MIRPRDGAAPHRQPPPWACRLCARCGELREPDDSGACGRCGAAACELWWRARAELVPLGRVARIRYQAARIAGVIVGVLVWPGIVALGVLAIAWADERPGLAAGLGAFVGLAIAGHRLVTNAALAVLWPVIRQWDVSSPDGRVTARIDCVARWWVRGAGASHDRTAPVTLDVDGPTAADVEAAGAAMVAVAVAGRIGRRLEAEHALVLAAVVRLAETGVLELGFADVRRWQRTGLPPRLAWTRRLADRGERALVVRRGPGAATPGTLEAAVLADIERQLAALREGVPVVVATRRASSGDVAPLAPLCLSPRLVPTLVERSRRESMPAGPSPAAVADGLAAVARAHPDLAAAILDAAESLRLDMLEVRGAGVRDVAEPGALAERAA